MLRLLTDATLLVALTLSILGTASAFGSAVNYTGSICKNYVNYEVWVPPTLNISAIEAELVQAGMTDQNLALLPSTCFNPFMEYVCSANFPRVISSESNNDTVLFACKSTCQSVVSQCTSTFTLAGKQNLIPNCDDPIPGTVQTIPPNGVLFQPDGACNVVTSLTNSSSQTSSSCLAPFIPDTMQGPNGTTTNPSSCSSGCCLPCPAQNSLYRTGIIDTENNINEGFRTVSLVLSFILVLSYTFLHDKRTHPSSLVFFNIICVFFYSAVVLFPLVNRRAIQCADEINFSTQQNNIKCAIQGAILVFASVGTCAWCAAIIMNLHLLAVWNNSWFARNNLLVNVLCWGYPVAVTAAALGMGEIRWDTGAFCLVSQEKSSELFFYPLAAIVFPSFLIHLCTFYHISRVTFKAPSSVSRSSLTNGETAPMSHRRHVILIVKLQWRAALMAILAILVVIFYWLFYFLQLGKVKPEILGPNIEKYFVSCLLEGGDQDTCADRLAPYLPPYSILAAADIVASSVGIVVFIIFFRPAVMRGLRERFEGSGLFGPKREKEEHEF
ncbi:hypothetical protein BGX20_005485, partial [Mortierella sp. AD010]